MNETQTARRDAFMVEYNRGSYGDGAPAPLLDVAPAPVIERHLAIYPHDGTQSIVLVSPHPDHGKVWITFGEITPNGFSACYATFVEDESKLRVEIDEPAPCDCGCVQGNYPCEYGSAGDGCGN